MIDETLIKMLALYAIVILALAGAFTLDASLTIARLHRMMLKRPDLKGLYEIRIHLRKQVHTRVMGSLAFWPLTMPWWTYAYFLSQEFKQDAIAHLKKGTQNADSAKTPAGDGSNATGNSPGSSP